MRTLETDKARPIATEKVRQGRRGSQVLMVLIGGLLLAMVAWAGAELYGEAIDPPAPATEQAPG